MTIYGEEVERDMADSTDPIVKKIWENKIVVQYTAELEVLYTTSALFLSMYYVSETFLTVHVSLMKYTMERKLRQNGKLVWIQLCGCVTQLLMADAWLTMIAP